MDNIDIRIVRNLSDCEVLWKKFSPRQMLWDLWGVVLSFYDESLHEPYFLVIMKDNNEELGVLPLWREKKSNDYYQFGGDYLESGTFWFNPVLFPKVFEAIPRSTVLFDLNAKSVEQILKLYPRFQPYFKKTDLHYFLNLENFNYNPSEYLKIFKKKHRKNLLYDLKKLEKLQYILQWKTTEHFDDFVSFSVKRFGQDSDLADPKFATAMRNLVNSLKQQEMLYTVTVLIDNKVEGVELAALYNNIYYILNGGYNRSVENLGKLLIWQHIQKAAELKARKIDFLVGDTGWKQLWNCESEICYTFEK